MRYPTTTLPLLHSSISRSLEKNHTMASNADGYAKAANQAYERRAQLLAVLQRAGFCSLCWLFADNKFAPGLHNSAFHCPRLIMGSNQCSEFKAQLRFSRGFFQCYKCCVPHLTPFKHPPNSTGCNLPDIIKPVAFEIFFLTRGCGQMYSANWGCEVITLTPFGATVAG